MKRNKQFTHGVKHQMGSRFLFAGFALFFVVTNACLSAEPPKELNAEITGINPKTIEFTTDDALSIGQKINILRIKGDAIYKVAVVKVVKIKRDTVLAEIEKQYKDILFEDTLRTVAELPPAEEKQKETPTAVTPAETKPEETQKETVATEPKTEEKKEETVAVTPTETKKEETPPQEIPSETKPEEQKTVATIPETLPPSEEAAPKPQTFGVSFGYSLFVPKSFKVSNNGFRGEARVGIPTVKNLYGALSYAQHRWTDKTTELKLNVLSVNLSYSLKPFLPQSLPFINDVQLMAGFSNLSSRLTQDTTALTKSASGFNAGVSCSFLKYLNIDYRFHSFTLDFPNGKIKNGEQVTASFSYSF